MKIKYLLGVAVAAVSADALACSTCLCGDPTLTTMGTEKPFAGRKRISLDFLSRTERIGITGFNRVETDEQRYNLGFSYTPTRRMSLSMTVPWVEKQMTNASLAEVETSALGDVNLTAKFYLQSDNGIAKTMYGLTAGVTLPTGELQKDSNGTPFDVDAQPGFGSTVPQVGVWYGRYRFPFFYYASSTLHLPGEGDQGFEPGISVATTLQAQYAQTHKLAWQVSLDTRWSDTDKFDGVKDENSGGFLGFLTPGVAFMVVEDVLIHARTQIPVIEELKGTHEEDTTFSIGVTYDF